MKKVLILLTSSLLLSCTNNFNNDLIQVNDIKSKIKISSSKKLITDLPSSSNKVFFENLKSACKGLYLISESDVEFQAFVWNSFGDINNEKLLKKIKQNPKLKVVKESKGINWLKDYSTEKFWLEGGYSKEEAKKLALSYKNLIDILSKNLKNIELYLVDDPSNLQYYPNDDLSGEVGFYLLGKYGNDIIGIYSYLVWT